MTSDADWAFAQYERVRDALPSASFPTRSIQIANIGEVADQFDVFLLDAFGVLNVGDTVIAGAPERVAALQAAGKQVFVATNGASLPPEVSLAKYRKFGFDFQQSDVIASRDALSVGLTGRIEKSWGVMALEHSKLEDFRCLVCVLDLRPRSMTKSKGLFFWVVPRGRRRIRTCSSPASSAIHVL